MGNNHSADLSEYSVKDYVELLLTDPKKALQTCRLDLVALPDNKSTTLKIGKTPLNDVKMGRLLADAEDVQDVKVYSLSTIKDSQPPLSPPYGSVPGYKLANPSVAEDPHLMVTAPFIGGSFVLKMVPNGDDKKVPLVAHLQAGGTRGQGKDLRVALSKKDTGFADTKERRFDAAFGDPAEYKMRDGLHVIVIGVYVNGSWQFWSQQSTKQEDGTYKVNNVDLLYKAPN
eukprot:TRINITY_DN753_c0_g1_i1.p1 TRINITY_DN753_c0_g1~~TRINITY_DN753_c0_g1_i1.p1  ORF type:complete len:229 (-),score=40.11 TRINITY_DN753_c0_g1_i1:390-1076(-)